MSSSGAAASLTESQRSALQELANIGAGHAATALASMINQTVSIDVPRVMAVRVESAPEAIGDPASVVCAVFLEVRGDAPGRMLLLLSPENARLVVDLVVGRPPGTTRDLNDEAVSVIKEVGNIISGSYLNALSKLMGLSLVNSIPDLTEDMLEAVLQGALVDLGEEADFAFLIGTDLLFSGRRVNAHFLLIPQVEALESFLQAMMRFSSPEGLS